MVKLTGELIAKQTPGHNKRRADESVEHYLSRLTHLPFQNRNVDSIVRIDFLYFDFYASSVFLSLGCHSTMSFIDCDLSL